MKGGDAQLTDGKPMAYTESLEFEWDEGKDLACRTRRGFGFADILPAFIDPGRKVEPDERHEYGEVRFVLYGRVAGRLFVVIFTRRGEAIRIISARKANERERKRHGDS